ncbi:MAG: guanylate kinase [Armatimonadetes bacterium CG2_30_59_28]|nr:guanylate kinase [Armatimonadota bacterium]OIO90867.1 MAG: guanylate kinase [Armatimonadetes bacterium CG2_30_59_28]PIU63969.1 MAG: guanylate kinase [Armatimonadetes bacterium CG07_land_8_20_14_0_80_59_28]PIX43919.1 MAG: guanylate kinase [Armatimonadetes bacterium CG_4_8_14_3_um_filter_58_9]PIY43603.1 MAG: guanylate kinase [Armatimonadetes bacterium CG_4_10_14_3_um_filter_59_10]
MLHRIGTLFVVSGPAGVGKDALIERVLPRVPTLRKSVSVTTRAPLNQVHGEAYFFISRDEFQGLLTEEALLEHARVHDNYYGTPSAWVREQLEGGHDVVLNIDVQGGLTIGRKCANPVLIFIMPPSLRELENRLRKRNRDGEQDIELRLKNAIAEMETSREYDHIIVNVDLDRASTELQSLIERVRAESPGTVIPR